jgi:hypothetical protein
MDMPESLTFCGRTFRASELELMRQIAREFSALGVTEIARTVCELLEWRRPSGGLKNHECRQLLERLQTESFLKLPDLQRLGGRGRDERTYPAPAWNRRPSHVPPASARLWNWPKWKAKSRAVGGASRWNGITTWDAACHSGRTCAIGCAIANGSWHVCSGHRRPGGCRLVMLGSAGMMSNGSATCNGS